MCICLLRVWKRFYTILHGLKNQLLSFSLWCVENCGVWKTMVCSFSNRKCHAEFKRIFHPSLTSICSTWKWRFCFIDNITIWQSISAYLNLNVERSLWLLCGNIMKNQMATVLYATFLYTAGIFIWEMSWLQTHFSFKGHLLKQFTCMTIEVNGDTCSQEAWTKWKEKDFMNFTSASTENSSAVLYVDTGLQYPLASSVHRAISVPSFWCGGLWC